MLLHKCFFFLLFQKENSFCHRVVLKDAQKPQVNVSQLPQKRALFVSHNQEELALTVAVEKIGNVKKKGCNDHLNKKKHVLNKSKRKNRKQSEKEYLVIVNKTKKKTGKKKREVNTG